MDKIKQWIIDHKENGSLIGIVGAPILWVLLGLALSALFYSCSAKADWLFPDGPVLYFYADFDRNNPFCEGGRDTTEISSNVGIRQTVFRKNGVSLIGSYTHHSCAFKVDDASYDALGFGIEWQIGR